MDTNLQEDLDCDNKLSKLVEEIFLNEHPRVLQLLNANNLDRPINKVLNKLENIDGFLAGTTPLYLNSLSSSFLMSINSQLGTIADQSQKKELEYIVGEISYELIYRIISISKLSPKEALDHISTGLKTTCEINDWDYNQVSRVIRFKILHLFSSKSSQPERPKGTIVPTYYTWNGRAEDLLDLSYNLKDRKAVRSTAEFQKLFNPNNSNPFQIRTHKNNLYFFIVLFDELKRKGLITPRGFKVGHFTPLRMILVDQEKNLLITKDPKRIKQAIRKDPKKFASLQADVQKWTEGYDLAKDPEVTLR